MILFNDFIRQIDCKSICFSLNKSINQKSDEYGIRIGECIDPFYLLLIIDPHLDAELSLGGRHDYSTEVVDKHIGKGCPYLLQFPTGFSNKSQTRRAYTVIPG